MAGRKALSSEPSIMAPMRKQLDVVGPNALAGIESLFL
ncbi:Uncharacterised protein [BD1-7 clade bacterium]|uniref:Uncharacterized protein n=1 Tax=BD1-7 clade bacterium TaxID=2029982 RepID=A0A5S9PHT5_9GAMM|nr:Uncharacterised protein [BD1-7 clade bacterium]